MNTAPASLIPSDARPLEVLGETDGWAPPAASEFVTGQEAEENGATGTSFVGRKGADPKTVGLLITATEYAVAAVQRMVQETSDPQALDELLRQYVDLVFGLEVGFVFPNLSADERERLVALMKIRNALGVQLNGLPQWRTANQKAEHDHVTANLKAQFFQLCREIASSGLECRLDRVQRKVLGEEFLSITLDKEDSTTMFFRKDLVGQTAEVPGASVRRPSCAPPETHRDRVASEEIARPKTEPVVPPVPRRPILLLSRETGETAQVREWVKSSGYELVFNPLDVHKLAEALQQKPGLILLEFQEIPEEFRATEDLDGATFLQMLRRLPATRHTPVIAISSGEHPGAKQDALAAGAMAYLRRPLESRKLLAAIRIALEDIEEEPKVDPSTGALGAKH